MFQIYAGENLVYEPGDSDLVLLTPKLTLEMGKAGSLEFTVPAGHPYAENLKTLTYPMSVKLDGESVFRGRVLSTSRTFYNQREVYCEGILSYLMDSVQKAEKYTGKTSDLFVEILNNHNARMPEEKWFWPGNVTEKLGDQDIFLLGQSADVSKYDYSQIAINSIVDNWNTTLDYIENTLISYCGGYLMVREGYDEDLGKVVNYLDWVEDYTSTATQEIVFGENLLDLTDETSAEDIFTVLIPLGDDNLTIKKVNAGSDEIADEAKVAKYGRIVKTNVFSNVTSAQTLLENGRRYLQNNGDVPTTFTLTAIDLHNVYPEIEAIHLGDRVYIRSDPHELSQYLTCTKIEYDLEKPENTVYTFGREKQTLTVRYRENKRASSNTYGTGSAGSAIADEAGGWHWLEENANEHADEAAAEAEENAKTHADNKIQELYDAYINLNPDQGDISLGAVYQKLLDDEAVLENNVGIDLDAPDGTINIFTDHTVLTNTADTAAQTATTTASIVLWAGGSFDDGTFGSKIALNADLVTVSNRLEAVEGVFSSISSEWARISRLLYAPSIYAGRFIVDDGTEESARLDLATHSHDLTCDASGYITAGGPVPEGTQKGFNIADTSFCQDLVKAATVDNVLGIKTDSSNYEDADDGFNVSLSSNVIYNTNDYQYCRINIRNDKNETLKKMTVRMPDRYREGETAGYQSGYEAALPNDITSSPTTRPDYGVNISAGEMRTAGDHHYVRGWFDLTAQHVISGGQIDQNSKYTEEGMFFDIDADEVFEAGGGGSGGSQELARLYAPIDDNPITAQYYAATEDDEAQYRINISEVYAFVEGSATTIGAKPLEFWAPASIFGGGGGTSSPVYVKGTNGVTLQLTPGTTLSLTVPGFQRTLQDGRFVYKAYYTLYLRTKSGNMYHTETSTEVIYA